MFVCGSGHVFEEIERVLFWRRRHNSRSYLHGTANWLDVIRALLFVFVFVVAMVLAGIAQGKQGDLCFDEYKNCAAWADVCSRLGELHLEGKCRKTCGDCTASAATTVSPAGATGGGMIEHLGHIAGVSWSFYIILSWIHLLRRSIGVQRHTG